MLAHTTYIWSVKSQYCELLRCLEVKQPQLFGYGIRYTAALQLFVLPESYSQLY